MKQKLETLLILLRDILFVNLGIPELALLNNILQHDNVRTSEHREARDLIAKIEKLDYLYKALESNVNPGLVYKAAREIWQEVNY